MLGSVLHRTTDIAGVKHIEARVEFTLGSRFYTSFARRAMTGQEADAVAALGEASLNVTLAAHIGRVLGEMKRERLERRRAMEEAEAFHRVVNSGAHDPAALQSYFNTWQQISEEIAENVAVSSRIVGLDLGSGDSTAVHIRTRTQSGQERSINAAGSRLDAFLQAYDLIGTYLSPTEAERRGQELLVSELSPRQRRQFERHQWFGVIGCDTGRRYRIVRGTQQNVYELNMFGRIKRGLCFIPNGRLVWGDVMLAQKTALELFENEVLKIAVEFNPALRATGLLGAFARYRAELDYEPY